MPASRTTLFASLLLSVVPCHGASSTVAPTGAGNEYQGVNLDDDSKTFRSLSPGTGRATIRISESVSVKHYTPENLGLNYEWRSTNRLLFPNARTQTPDPEIDALLSGLRMPLNRMAGASSQSYRWKESIGPLSERTPQEANDKKICRLGPIEWIKWTTTIDPRARFTWVFNLINDTPADHADLVEFLTGDPANDPNGGINWAQRRVDYGIPAPVPVHIWEIGNELDWDKKSLWDIDHYIRNARETITAIRAVNPRARIAVHAKTAAWSPRPAETRPWHHWHQELLRQLATHIDYISFHFYYDGHTVTRLETFTKKILDDIHAITGSTRIQLYISEHARWPARPKDGPWEQNWHQTHSLGGTLSTARYLIRILNTPGITAASYHAFSSGPWGLIYRDPQTRQPYTTGIFDLYKLLGQIEASAVLSTRTTTPAHPAPNTDLTLQAATLRAPDGLHLLITNHGPARHLAIVLEKPYNVADARQITAPDLDAHNTATKRPVTLQSAPRYLSSAPLNQFDIPSNTLLWLRLTQN